MSPPLPPKAEKRPARIEQLGRVREDEYAWMKDENWQAVMRDPAALRPDIRMHLEAENAYTAAQLASTQALQGAMFEEMKGCIATRHCIAGHATQPELRPARQVRGE